MPVKAGICKRSHHSQLSQSSSCNKYLYAAAYRFSGIMQIIYISTIIYENKSGSQIFTEDKYTVHLSAQHFTTDKNQGFSCSYYFFSQKIILPEIFQEEIQIVKLYFQKQSMGTNIITTVLHVLD